MPRRILLVILGFFSFSVLASEIPLSPERRPEQNWEEALSQSVARQRALIEPESSLEVSEINPRAIGGIPSWPGDWNSLTKLFTDARDVRHYANPNPGNFNRKAAWLYVNDGCYSKAAHVSFIAKSQGLVQPGKIYAYGNLRFNSPYAKNGRVVYWTYHMAAAYHIGDVIYVLDPAVSPGGVLTKDQWAAMISPTPASLRFSLCDARSYSPYSTCRGGSGNGAYIGSMSNILRMEWSNLTRLGYSPAALLGP